MPEVIGSAGEFFDPANTDDMRRAIEEVVYSECRIANLKKEGAVRLTTFSWNKCSQQTLDIYHSLI
jgi:glycosyltransferase involved in cell wall biosynthesis